MNYQTLLLHISNNKNINYSGYIDILYSASRSVRWYRVCYNAICGY